MAWLKVGTEALAWGMTLLALLMIASTFALDLLALSEHLTTWMAQGIQRLKSPKFQISAVALLGLSVALQLALSAWSDGAIWGKFKSMTEQTEQESNQTPLSTLAAQWFLDALSWRLMRGLIRGGVGLLSLMTYVALIRFGALGSPLVVSLVTGLIYAALIIFVILCVVATEITPAIQVIRDVDLGEALLEAAQLAIDKLFVFYRIAILCALMLLIPAALYWMVFFVGQLPESQNSALLMTARMMVELLLFISMVFASVVFRGATILYTGVVTETLPSLDGMLHGRDELKTTEDTIVSLNDYLPEETPHIFQLSITLEPQAHLSAPLADISEHPEKTPT